MINKFWKNKKVIITGNTGFKGSWFSLVLILSGAKVYGFSEKKNNNDIFFKTLNLKSFYKTSYGDISNFNSFNKFYKKIKPDILVHMAAQPYVFKSYDIPLKTIKDNVIGTANILETIRVNKSPKITLIITSDKCYVNSERKKYFKEKDPLGGNDIYSASKGMAEILCNSYYKSFTNLGNIITVRAGNIFGGGDFGENRLIPDYFKSISKRKNIIIRNPKSIRPWQYILKPISNYMMVIEKFYSKKNYFNNFNIGPGKNSHIEVLKIIKVLDKINKLTKSYEIKKSKRKESKILKLDNSKFNNLFSVKKDKNIEHYLSLTNQWYSLFYKKNKKEIFNFTINHIKSYFKDS